MFAGVGEVAEVPGDKVIDLVDRGDGEMDGVGDVFAAKDATVDIAVGEDRGFLGQVELVEGLDEIQITCAMRFGQAFEFSLDHDRAKRAVFA